MGSRLLHREQHWCDGQVCKLVHITCWWWWSLIKLSYGPAIVCGLINKYLFVNNRIFFMLFWFIKDDVFYYHFCIFWQTCIPSNACSTCNIVTDWCECASSHAIDFCDILLLIVVFVLWWSENNSVLFFKK